LLLLLLRRLSKQADAINRGSAGYSSSARLKILPRLEVLLLLLLLLLLSKQADVINRGFEGYSSSAVLNILPELLPDLAQQQALLVTVMLGTTDAAQQDTAQ
jgi:hypothetical protein